MTTYEMLYVKKLRPGSLVRVAVPSDKTNNPAKKLNGREFVIKDVKHYSKGSGPNRAMFTLYGAESEAGMPYWFLPNELIYVRDEVW